MVTPLTYSVGLFEGDQDIDIALEINSTFGEGVNDLELSSMIHQTDMLAPSFARLHYQSSEYQEELAKIVADTRAKLDANDLGKKVIQHWRAKEDETSGKYRVVIAVALLMRAGAKIEK